MMGLLHPQDTSQTASMSLHSTIAGHPEPVSSGTITTLASGGWTSPVGTANTSYRFKVPVKVVGENWSRENVPRVHRGLSYYKLHLDTADCGVPLNSILASASVHDS